MAAFAETIRAVVRTIPSGSTMSYKDVATLAGNPKAARAVARVMASNFDLTVPCHRVINSNGALGGYNRGGTAEKRRLLQSEGAIL